MAPEQYLEGSLAAELCLGRVPGLERAVGRTLGGHRLVRGCAGAFGWQRLAWLSRDLVLSCVLLPAASQGVRTERGTGGQAVSKGNYCRNSLRSAPASGRRRDACSLILHVYLKQGLKASGVLIKIIKCLHFFLPPLSFGFNLIKGRV